MRCKNCGWPNKPNETACVKCGSPLDAVSQMPDYADDYVSSRPMPQGNGDDGLKKTVMESNVFGENINERYTPETTNIQKTVNEIDCPKCGYPMRADASKCPNCNFSVKGGNDTRPLNEDNGGGYQRRPTRMADAPEKVLEPQIIPKLGSAPRIVSDKRKLRGTINPYMMNLQQDPIFVLTPLQRMNERKVAEPVELEGSEVVLTRDNTEPDNPSITSKAQAVISHADGHWYIENCSEQKTTFVMANEKIELHNGDIILLGNRMFEFKELQ